MSASHSAASGQPPLVAAQARALVGALAAAAAHGPIGPATVLAATATLNRLLVTLAEYEAVADELADEALSAERDRHAAIAAGEVVPFPRRPGITTSAGAVA